MRSCSGFFVSFQVIGIFGYIRDGVSRVKCVVSAGRRRLMHPVFLSLSIPAEFVTIPRVVFLISKKAITSATWREHRFTRSQWSCHPLTQRDSKRWWENGTYHPAYCARQCCHRLQALQADEVTARQAFWLHIRRVSLPLTLGAAHVSWCTTAVGRNKPTSWTHLEAADQKQKNISGTHHSRKTTLSSPDWHFPH